MCSSLLGLGTMARCWAVLLCCSLATSLQLVLSGLRRGERFEERGWEGVISKLMQLSDLSEQRLIQETAMTLMRSH